METVRLELTTPSLQSWCSATSLYSVLLQLSPENKNFNGSHILYGIVTLMGFKKNDIVICILGVNKSLLHDDRHSLEYGSIYKVVKDQDGPMVSIDMKYKILYWYAYRFILFNKLNRLFYAS